MKGLTRWQRMLPASPRLAYFPSKPIVLRENKWERLRGIAKNIPLSTGAQLRLEWMIFYYTVGERKAKRTASYFGISRKTFHKWLRRFDERSLGSLEELSRAPHKTRTWMVTPEEEVRIIKLRKKHLKYGKMKLARRYFKEHGEIISSWKIQRVIERHQLYPDPVKAAKLRKKKARAMKKKRIQQLLKKKSFGFLWHLDVIIIWWYGVKRVIFTALEELTKIAYARIYPTNSSKNAEEFLKRLLYVSDHQIENIHHDLGISQYYSRVRTAQDNAALERFNWTLQDEWLEMTDVGLENINQANLDLTKWLIEYNNLRPHQALDYLSPLEYAEKHKVLPMSPSRTFS